MSYFKHIANRPGGHGTLQACGDGLFQKPVSQIEFENTQRLLSTPLYAFLPHCYSLDDDTPNRTVLMSDNVNHSDRTQTRTGDYGVFYLISLASMMMSHPHKIITFKVSTRFMS